MPAEYYDLTYLNVLVATALIAVNGMISVALKLGLEKRLAVGAIRTVVQLTLIGYVLQWIFDSENIAVIVAMMLVRSLVAGIAAVSRVERRFPGVWLNSIIATMASSWLVTMIALTAVIPPNVWWAQRAQYLIPLLGMILGNMLNGVSLGMDRLSGQLTAERRSVEMHLTLGATRWEAARSAIRQAVRTGMIPMINSMMVVGLVSLPGMMTGQLLAGVNPLGAVKYQIAIMFLIAAATALSTIGVVLLSYRRLFNRRHQFLFERIRKAS